MTGTMTLKQKLLQRRAKRYVYFLMGFVSGTAVVQGLHFMAQYLGLS